MDYILTFFTSDFALMQILLVVSEARRPILVNTYLTIYGNKYQM